MLHAGTVAKNWSGPYQVGGTTAAGEAMPEGGRVDDATDQAATQHQPCVSHTPQQLQTEQPAQHQDGHWLCMWLLVAEKQHHESLLSLLTVVQEMPIERVLVGVFLSAWNAL